MPPDTSAEEFIVANEKAFQDLFYKQTAEDQADCFINKVGQSIALLESYAKEQVAIAVKKEREEIVEDLKKEMNGWEKPCTESGAFKWIINLIQSRNQKEEVK